MRFVLWNQQRRETAESSEINLTPLIDVSLVLVVILLLATPLALESSFAVRHAQASTRQADDEEKISRIELAIVSEDSVRVNTRPVPRDRLGQALAGMLASGAVREVSVTCAGEVSHGTFVEVLDVAKLSGATRISFVGR
jgi:biopolymer transport protein ExbD